MDLVAVKMENFMGKKVFTTYYPVHTAHICKCICRKSFCEENQHNCRVVK